MRELTASEILELVSGAGAVWNNELGGWTITPSGGTSYPSSAYLPPPTYNPLTGTYFNPAPGGGGGTENTSTSIYNEYQAARNAPSLAPDNPTQNGTSVNWSFVTNGEANKGTMYDDGYGNQTIATGINVTAMNSTELAGIQTVDPQLAAALQPYIGLTVTQAANEGLPPLTITWQQTQELTQFFFTQNMSYVQAQFPQFDSLTPAEQTVVFDMYWNSGSSVYNYNGDAVRNDINSGSWTALGDLLENSADWPSYLVPSRRYSEGSYLLGSLGASSGGGGTGTGGGGGSTGGTGFKNR